MDSRWKSRPRSRPNSICDSATWATLRLKVLPRPALDAVQRLIQVLHGIGDAEAQIAFAVGAEGGAGQAGYAGLFQQRIGHFLRGPAGLADAGEGVEGAF